MLKHCRPDILARGHLSLLHRVCSKYEYFMLRVSILLSELLIQGYSSWKLQITLGAWGGGGGWGGGAEFNPVAAELNMYK